MTEKYNRIELVDVFRGFALLLITLIHFVEHFELFYLPEINFFFSPETDQRVMDGVYFFISGKAYSIFALMFGFTFFIQTNGNYSGERFAWRLFILLIIGFLHSLIYKGDILHIYAMMGILFFVFHTLKTRTLIWIAILLAIQIPLLYNLWLSFIDPQFKYLKTFGWNYWEEADLIYATGNLTDVISFNFWKGRTTSWGWTYYNGRYLQLLTLLIIGFLLGRKRVFENIRMYGRKVAILLAAGVLLTVSLYFLNSAAGKSDLTSASRELLEILGGSFFNLAFTSSLVCFIILIVLKFKRSFLFDMLAAFGRMSLSNYIFQAVFGVVFFYGFGLGMYKYIGSAWSLLLGLLFFTIQALVSVYWIKKYHYGPMEWLWRSLTFLDFRIRLKKV